MTDDELEDVVTCEGDHSGDEAPPQLWGTDDASAEELADAAGWLDTDEGWRCPDPRHDSERVSLYEATVPSTHDHPITAVTASAERVSDFVLTTLEQFPGDVAVALEFHVQRTPATVAEVRAVFDDLEREGEGEGTDGAE